jgi:hypothetical protein
LREIIHWFLVNILLFSLLILVGDSGSQRLADIGIKNLD